MFIAQILIFQFVLHTKCTRHKIILFFYIFFVKPYAYSSLFRLVFASFCEKIIFTLIGLWFIIGLIFGKMEKMCWDFLSDFHFMTIVVTHGWMGFWCIYLIQFPCKIINNCPRWRRKITHGWMDGLDDCWKAYVFFWNDTANCHVILGMFCCHYGDWSNISLIILVLKLVSHSFEYL